jgi:hypothetical protein
MKVTRCAARLGENEEKDEEDDPGHDDPRYDLLHLITSQRALAITGEAAQGKSAVTA